MEQLRAFRQGLKEVGYVEGENVAIEYRWAVISRIDYQRWQPNLVHRQVTVIAANRGAHVGVRSQGGDRDDPHRFRFGDDPVKHGLVASLAQPGGNVTGINFLSIELVAKRLEHLRELVRGAARVAVLVNPVNVPNTELTLRDMEGGGSQHRIAVSGPLRRHSARDRWRVRKYRTRTARRSIRRDHAVVRRSACSIGPIGGVPQDFLQCMEGAILPKPEA